MVNQDKYPILSVLVDADIEFELYEHQPVFTVEEGKSVTGHIPGCGTKNLFLTDKKSTKFALLFVEESKRVALKELKNIFGWDKVSFASAEHLRTLLGVEPGSVTPLAAFSTQALDSTGSVKIFYDNDLLKSKLIQMHPMINSATVVVSSNRFLVDLFNARKINITGINIPIMIPS